MAENDDFPGFEPLTDDPAAVADIDPAVASFVQGVMDVFYRGNPQEPDRIWGEVQALIARHPAPPRMLGASVADQARALVEAAWESGDGARLALDALRVWPECCEAFEYLGLNAEGEPMLQLPLFTLAVMAGFNALGQETFDRHAGEFWVREETRPFMSAIGNLARANRDAGALDAAAAHFMEMLRLNPRDDQGARYELVSTLLEMGEAQQASEMMGMYQEDGAAFAFAGALATLQRRGDTDEARLALRSAKEKNVHVAAFLTGATPIPAEFPDDAGPGSPGEALAIIDLLGPAFEATAGSVDWIRRQVTVAPAAPPAKERRSGPRSLDI